MPIDVTCPGCKTRFKVSDQFAGKKGPCPKCKVVISVPAASEQVVVHAPDQFGPKGGKGVGVLKPIFRQETKISIPVVVGVAVTLLIVLVMSIYTRVTYVDWQQVPTLFLALGAALLAPGCVWAAYAFLRDSELEPYRGLQLLIRVLICSVVYAALWGGHWWVKSAFFENKPLQSYDLLYVVPPMVVAGGFACFATLELSFSMGMLHYAFYGLITVLLRLVVRQGPF
jgi:hypothetical protein